MVTAIKADIGVVEQQNWLSVIPAEVPKTKTAEAFLAKFVKQEVRLKSLFKIVVNIFRS